MKVYKIQVTLISYRIKEVSEVVEEVEITKETGKRFYYENVGILYKDCEEKLEKVFNGYKTYTRNPKNIRKMLTEIKLKMIAELDAVIIRADEDRQRILATITEKDLKGEANGEEEKPISNE